MYTIVMQMSGMNRYLKASSKALTPIGQVFPRDQRRIELEFKEDLNFHYMARIGDNIIAAIEFRRYVQIGKVSPSDLIAFCVNENIIRTGNVRPFFEQLVKVRKSIRPIIVIQV